MSLDPPNVGDILEGTIARVEPYGAFCRLLDGRRLQGLIHISQLMAGQRVERVEDVVSVEDHVWVKVLNVEMDPSTQRWRIQLSRKDVSQDGMATDLGLEQQRKENQRDQLEASLNSSIGMGVARDPMADRLIMKNAGSSRGAVFRGGYSLVGDDEGEPDRPPAAVDAETSVTSRVAPMGRGRGTTLPAWMTTTSDGPTGGGEDDEASDSDGSREDFKKKKKKHKKKHSKERKKRDRKESSNKGRKRRYHREPGSSNSESPGNGDDCSDDSNGDPNRSKREKTTKRKKSTKEHRSRSRDDHIERSRESRDGRH